MSDLSAHICKYLEVSNSHISKETANALEKEEIQSTRYGNGWIISVRTKDADGNLITYPPDLAKLIILAMMNDCGYLRLDNYNYTLPEELGVEIYDW